MVLCYRTAFHTSLVLLISGPASRNISISSTKALILICTMLSHFFYVLFFMHISTYSALFMHYIPLIHLLNKIQKHCFFQKVSGYQTWPPYNNEEMAHKLELKTHDIWPPQFAKHGFDQ